eukprot:3694393-Alexandrium_andersonii.AAC.1
MPTGSWRHLRRLHEGCRACRPRGALRDRGGVGEVLGAQRGRERRPGRAAALRGHRLDQGAHQREIHGAGH